MARRSRRRPARRRARRRVSTALVVTRGRRRRTVSRSRYRKAVRRGRRMRVRRAVRRGVGAVGNLSVKQIFSPEMLKTYAGAAGGAIVPGLILDKLPAQYVPDVLMTPNVRPAVEFGIAALGAITLRKFLGARVSNAIVIGAGAQAVVKYATPVIAKYLPAPTGVAGLGEDLWSENANLPGGSSMPLLEGGDDDDGELRGLLDDSLVEVDD